MALLALIEKVDPLKTLNWVSAQSKSLYEEMVCATVKPGPR